MKSPYTRARAILSTSLLLLSSANLYAQTDKEIVATQKLTIQQLKAENEELRALLKMDAAPEVKKTASTSTNSYIVQKGDSLFKISQKFGVSIDSLAKANSIKDKKSINTGQKLVIPKKGSISTTKKTTSTSTPKKLPDVYKIKKGDTYFSISREYGISVKSLMAANPKIKASRLVPGYTVIRFPSKQTKQAVAQKETPKTVTKKPTTSKSSTSSAKVKESKAPSSSPYKEITLVSEMSFGDLAKRYGMSITELNELNGWNYKSTTKLAKGSVAYVKNK